MADDVNPFPSLEDDLEDVVLGEDDVVLEAELPQPYGTCWEFDFSKGDLRLTPGGGSVLLRDEDTLRQWCQHILNVTRGESVIYSDETGTRLSDLLGGNLNDNFIISRIGQEITDGLAQHDRIQTVVVNDVIPTGHEVLAFITITTDDEVVVEDLFSLSGQ